MQPLVVPFCTDDEAHTEAVRILGAHAPRSSVRAPIEVVRNQVRIHTSDHCSIASWATSTR